MPFEPVVILVSHGTRSAAGASAVAGMCGAVRALLPGSSVHEAFVDVEEPGVEQVVRGLEGRPAVLVPLLLSGGYHVRVDLPRAARLAPGVELAPALGPDERLAGLLVDRLVEAGSRPGDAVVLGAAGSSDPRARADVAAVADLLADRLERPVSVAYGGTGEPGIEAAVQAARHRGARRVAVASYLLAPGFFASRLAARSGADVVAAPLLSAGDPPPPALLDLILDRVRSAQTADVSRAA